MASYAGEAERSLSLSSPPLFLSLAFQHNEEGHAGGEMRCLRGEGGRKRYVAPACLLAWCVCVCVEAIRHGERLLRKLEPSSLSPVHTHTHTYIRKDTKTLLLSLSYVGVSSWETAKDLKKGKAQHTHTDRHTDRQRETHREDTTSAKECIPSGSWQP